MKTFFIRLWKNIKRQFIAFILLTWYVWVAVALGFIVKWIFGGTSGILTFFGVIGIVIVYIFLRQIYWWFTGKVDYKNGGFPKLLKKIFQK